MVVGRCRRVVAGARRPRQGDGRAAEPRAGARRLPGAWRQGPVLREPALGRPRSMVAGDERTFLATALDALQGLMIAFEVLFWMSVSGVFYPYFGYPMMLH